MFRVSEENGLSIKAKYCFRHDSSNPVIVPRTKKIGMATFHTLKTSKYSG